MSLFKQLKDVKDLFMYSVLNNEARGILNLYTHPASRYSSSSNYRTILPRQRTNINKKSVAFSSAFL